MNNLDIPKTITSMIEDFYKRLVDSEIIRKVTTFDVDTISTRLKICDKCSLLDVSSTLPICKSCNCPVSVKVLWPYAKCPENKWDTAINEEIPPSPPKNLITVEPLSSDPSIHNNLS